MNKWKWTSKDKNRRMVKWWRKGLKGKSWKKENKRWTSESEKVEVNVKKCKQVEMEVKIGEWSSGGGKKLKSKSKQ